MKEETHRAVLCPGSNAGNTKRGLLSEVYTPGMLSAKHPPMLNHVRRITNVAYQMQKKARLVRNFIVVH